MHIAIRIQYSYLAEHRYIGMMNKSERLVSCLPVSSDVRHLKHERPERAFEWRSSESYSLERLCGQCDAESARCRRWKRRPLECRVAPAEQSHCCGVGDIQFLFAVAALQTSHSRAGRSGGRKRTCKNDAERRVPLPVENRRVQCT